jgi:hypothetical protein
MPSNRPNLTLDEQSFEGLLSAAFTVQEHNDRLKQAQPTRAEPELNNLCPHCGTPTVAGRSRCASCGLDELRPGERLQRNWASMWLMSQEQGLWPERSPEIREGMRKGVPPLDPERRPRAQPALDFAPSGILTLPLAKDVAQEPIAREKTPTIQHQALGKSALGKSALAKSVPAKMPGKATAEGPWITKATADFPQEKLTPEEATQDDLTQEDLTQEDLIQDDLTQEDLTQEDPTQDDSALAAIPFQLSATDDSYPSDATIRIDDDAPRSLLQRFAAWRVKLHFQRADLYLGVAVFVAALALLWPAAGAPHRAALGPWERALVTLGIAEAPAPLVHLHGDPSLAVWVDPHSALYYCPGEEQYGKTADGRFSPQREAQMDRFEPAGRSACE